MILKIFWCLVFFYLVIGEPFARYISYKRIQSNLQQGRNARIWHYYENIIRYWVVFIAAIVGLKLCGYQLSQVGFQFVQWKHFYAQPIWLQLLTILGLVSYFIYYYFIPLVLARFNEKIRQDVLVKIKGVQYIAPTNNRERWSWILFSLNGGIEEFLFRGLVFLFVFSFMSGIEAILFAIILSAVLEAWRFMPRYFVVANVLCTGLLFALLYYCFQSLYIGILIHFLQYIKIFAMPFEKK